MVWKVRARCARIDGDVLLQSVCHYDPDGLGNRCDSFVNVQETENEVVCPAITTRMTMRSPHVELVVDNRTTAHIPAVARDG